MRRYLALGTVICALLGNMLSCQPERDPRAGNGGQSTGTAAVTTDSVTATTDVSLSRSTVERLVQLTIDNPQLTQFFHQKEIPGRAPLIVLLNDVVRTEYNLTKFDRPVLFKLHSALAKDEPFFEITAISVEGASARVQFRYPPEGLVGTITFLKGTAEDWSVMTAEIVER